MQLQDFREIAKIRERGQLTIPYKIREVLTWLQENSLVEIILKTNNGIEIKPFRTLGQMKQKKARSKEDIELLWQKIRAISKAGRQINLAEFVVRDRERH